MSIPKIITPTEDILKSGWNDFLPNPLKSGEKVIVHGDQDNIEKGYVRVKHGDSGNKSISIFHLSHFIDLKGNKIIH